jgi:hypothetical protein
MHYPIAQKSSLDWQISAERRARTPGGLTVRHGQEFQEMRPQE